MSMGKWLEDRKVQINHGKLDEGKGTPKQESETKS